LEPNADFTVWTLKLKPGIKFTDGTAYDSAAVKFVLDRQAKEGNANPRGQLTQFVDTITVVDATTLTFKLKLGWVGFPYVLSGANGMIYSPTAFQKVNDAAKFNITPSDAGAGPFKVKAYKPGESLELERNATYHGGEPYLDGVKFVTISGAQATYDAIKTGTLQAGYVVDSAVTAKAKADKFETNMTLSVAGNTINMNSGIEVVCASGAPANLCAGKPDGEKVKAKTATSDLRVRRAVAAAVDPKVINERVYQGTALPNSSPFANSPWDPKVEGPKADVAEAKRLVTEAKSAGWDGKIRVMAANTPEGTNWAEAVRSQLVSAGMEVSVDNTKDTAGVVNQVLTLRDYDLASWGYAILDDVDAAYTALLASFNSKTLRYGFGNADFDAAVELLRTADTDPKRVEAYKKISEIWIRDLPAHVMTALPQGWIYSPKLHGVQRTAYTSYHLDKAWLEK
jgi:peptide/nickel transport system substrate-binding protein